MVKPISLRLRDDELSARTRRVLRRFDQEQKIKFLATKALSAVYEMDAAAEPRLKSVSVSARDDWKGEYEVLVSILRKIAKRGVW